MYRFRAILFVVLALFLTACPGGEGVTGSAPQITSFTANPETITAAGQAVALSWTVTNGVTTLELDNGVGEVSGTSEVVYPTATTTYTLSASNSSGTTTQSVEVTVGPGVGPTPGPGAEDGLPPTLNTFGVSLTQSNFQSDQGSNIENASDPRVVRVQPNSTFYAVVSATDPGGIAGVTIFLANRSPTGLMGDLVQGQSVGGFTLNGEVSNCVLDGTQTSVTCVYEIAVGNIPNITALPGVSGEFAYVFRTRVADAAGNEVNDPPRGYVIVGEGGGTPNPPPGNPPPSDPPPGNPPPPSDPPPGNPPPPSDPPPGNPPANRAPNADFTFDQEDETLRVAFKSTSTDPDNDTLTYAWTFGDGKTATTRDFTNPYAKAGKYSVSLKVTDPNGKSDTETESVTVEPVGGGGGDNKAPTANAGEDQSNVTQNATVSLNGDGTDPDGAIASYSWTLIAPDKTSATSSLSSSTVKAPTFKASQTGTYVASLKVKDDDGAESAADTVNISVVAATSSPVNTRPTANAGRDQEVLVNTTVTLDGTGSSDPDVGQTDTLKYVWTLKGPDGTDASNLLNSDNTAKPTFRPTTEGNYVASLVVTDTENASSLEDTVKITVVPPPNKKPIANAGEDQSSITQGATVTLDGSKSSDPDAAAGGTLKYSWTLKAPGGSDTTTSLNDKAAVKPTFKADTVGEYVATLVVTDAKNDLSESDSVKITVVQ